jgi:hypothetical protein
MRPTRSRVARHLALIAGVTAVLVFVMLRPFLPGRHDGLAVPLSTMVQVFGVVGLLLLPVGLAWLVHELRSERKNGRRRYVFASLTAGFVVAAAVSLAGVATSGLALGIVTAGVALSLGVRCVRVLNSETDAERGAFNAAPLYLVCLPVLVLVFQSALAARTLDWSRSRAIAHSASFIGDIERYRAANGMYPASLGATWPDYDTGVVGIERHTYARRGDAYNVFFLLPGFLLKDFGTREFVVYNPRDEHTITSHTNGILLATPDRPLEGQGWYASRDTGVPHWKSFLFD